MYIIDPHTKVITSHLRDENDQMMIIKSFQVLKTENVLALAIMSAIKEIVNFRDIEEAQSLLLALCIMVIQKSKYFSLYEQSDLIQFFLFGYDHVKNVEAILESLERDDYEYSFLQRALKGAIKSAKRYPYVNKGEESVSFERVSLPPKVLQHF